MVVFSLLQINAYFYALKLFIKNELRFPKFSHISASKSSTRTCCLLTNVLIQSLSPALAHIGFPARIPACDFSNHSSVTREKQPLFVHSTLPGAVDRRKKSVFVIISFLEQNLKKFTVASMYTVIDNSWYQLHLILPYAKL